MVIRINPAHPALWRSTSHLQLGSGSQLVSLPDLSIQQQRLIAMLYKGVADNAIDDSATTAGLDQEGKSSLLSKLEPLLIKKQIESDRRTSLSPDFITTALSEISRASLLNRTDGEEVLRLRSIRSVHIESLSKTGIMLALGLSQSGIQKLVSHDEHRVGNRDVSSLAYPASDLGKRRFDAALNLLGNTLSGGKIVLGSSLKEFELEKVDCAVLIGHHVIEPRRYARWLNRAIPHLSITFGTESTDVSAMVIPGITPCLYCREVERTKEDPDWPLLASQLSQTNQHFDDSVAQLFAASMALEKILKQVDCSIGFEDRERSDFSATLIHSTGEVLLSKWDSDPECECRSASWIQDGEKP